MGRIGKLYKNKIHLPQGTLPETSTGKNPSVITVYQYSEKTFRKITITTPSECLAYINGPDNTWIDVIGIEDPEVVSAFGAELNIHPLILEDIMDPLHRPKMEEYADYLFIIIKNLIMNKETCRIEREQISMLCSAKVVITFRQKDGPVFSSIIQRMETGYGRLKKLGTDYLLCAFLDAIVDRYFLVLEDIDALLDSAEDTISRNNSSIPELYTLKKQIGIMHRLVWPVRDFLSAIIKLEHKLLSKTTRLFFRDIHDHVIQIQDFLSSFQENVSSLRELSISANGERLNTIMKFLTLISTIFIPLTFIAGIYGMNFHFMPELAWRPGYFTVLCVMAVIAVVMIMIFKKKKWFK